MDSPGTDDDIGDEHLFDGVRFLLVGFDRDDASQYRSEMVRRGGADAGSLGNGCTHLVVWNRVYDDPTCVAARAQGKKVVTGLWVEDSLDQGVLADADRVIYWPMRHLKGIPGAQSLLICLTGYQKSYREDMMKMVSLMGARFSKPLVANAVTHLICYKFEGDKYEVAKKVNIKLVNHRWLEDCLKAWEILPVSDYSKSTWELELMDTEVIDSEHEAEASDPRSLNNGPSDSGNREVVAGRNLDTPVHIINTEDANNKTRDIRDQTNANSMVTVSAKADVFAPIQSPPVRIMNIKDADSKTHDITGQDSPDSSLLAISAKVDILTPLQSSSEKREIVRNTNSPNPQEAKEKYVGERTHDLASGVLGPPSTSKMTVFGNNHVETLNGTQGILKGHTDHVSGKYSASHNHTDVAEDLLTSPLGGNRSVDELDSSKVDRWQRQDKVGPSSVHIAAAGQLNADAKLKNHESNPKTGDDSMSNNINNTSNYKKASQKSFVQGHSINHMASPQRAEGSTLRAYSNISTVETGHQKVVEHADFQSIEENENPMSEDGLDGAYTQEMKSLVSPVSLNLQKEDLVSETGPSDSPSVSRLSDASETANVSSGRINLAEANAVNLGKQHSSFSTSKQTKSRKIFLKHGGPINGIKLSEYSSCDKNVKSLQKTRMSFKATAESKYTMSSSATIQDGKTSAGFPFQNKDGERTQTSGNTVNQDCLNEIGNACTKDQDQAHDKSVHSSSNSQSVPSYGNAGNRIADSVKVNGNEVAVASNFELEKVVSDATVKESTKEFQDTSRNVQAETSYSKKVPTTIRRNAGVKRHRSTNIDTEGPVINSAKKVVPESLSAKVIRHEHADPTSNNGYSTACAAELKTNLANKALICRVTDTVAKRTRSACAKIDDAWVGSSLEFYKVMSQENIQVNPQTNLDTANAGEQQRNSPKKIKNTRVRNRDAKGSWKSDTNMSNDTLIVKTETVASGSLFDDWFSSDNVEDWSKKISSDVNDCETLSPKAISNARIMNGAARRKTKTVEDKSGSKFGKIGSAITSETKAFSSKKTEGISCNINKVTADPASEKSNKDVMRGVSGLLCHDSVTVDNQRSYNSKLRSSKRNNILTSDHDKEKRQDCSDVNSKPNRTVSLCSKSDAKSVKKNTHVLSKHQRGKRIESGTGTLILREPGLFILSGNRQQRRDYRSILRRLKGRVCRDSHQWSYQATHFLVPDPLRRTEKFFAAAAAGRWILKTDYLASCIEAGKFVDEEPFEWFGTGFNDGRTISFDAPRKWRNIRQQMGHGAFYGMQIVVYGQLKLPTLDTVKRAVIAGDGTILATSPPYARFLESGVDFALVSESMPRTDAWVQEFISHGIPCVSAEYLVEYVCKPGQPLDQHVLFKTNRVASKSLEKLMKNQQEMATVKSEPLEDSDDDDDDPEDLSCSACGRKDRGDVMLICGDEDGEIGCGIGMHIDCCDPPLDAVTDDDWLCPKCAVPKPKTKHTRGTESRKARGSRRR